jgi:uncharacterized membrane protein
MKQRSFPAVFIAILLLLICVFPLQGWLTHVFPRISGHATIEPSLAIFEIPIQLPFPIDLILVSGLFIILYSITVLIFSAGLRKRLSAVFLGIITIVLCVAAGALISWLIRDHLPNQIREGMRSLAVNAELHLPGTHYPNIHLLGDTLTLLGLIIGIVISIRIISKSPQARVPAKKRTRLTPEQRMTPYQRMLLERRYGTPLQPNVGPHQPNVSPHQPNLSAHQPNVSRHQPNPIPRQPDPLPSKSVSAYASPTLPQTRVSPIPRHPEPSHGLCRNEPLPSLQPEAVNFRPLG